MTSFQDVKVRDLRLEIYDLFHSFDVDVFEISRLKSGQWFIVLNFVDAEQAEIARTTYSTYTLPSGNRIKCESTRVPKRFLKDMPWASSRSEG